MTSAPLTLYAFETLPGFFNLSPFGTKAEILLKLADLPYRLEAPEDHKAFSKGKLPVLKDGKDIIEDSEFIRLHIAENYGKPLSGNLTPEQQAIGHCLIRTFEERTMLGLIYGRWVEDTGWVVLEQFFFGGLPPEQRTVVAQTAREQVAGGVKSTGFGKHSSKQRTALLTADIDAAATLLDNSPWFFSDEPTHLDAALFGMLANFYAAPIPTVLTGLVGAHANLVAYVERGIEEWYPDAKTILSQNAAE